MNSPPRNPPKQLYILKTPYSLKQYTYSVVNTWMKKSIHNKSCGHNAQHDGTNNLFPPVQKKNWIFFPGVLVVHVVRKPDSNLSASFVPFPLVVGQIVAVVFEEKIGYYCPQTTKEVCLVKAR